MLEIYAANDKSGWFVWFGDLGEGWVVFYPPMRWSSNPSSHRELVTEEWTRLWPKEDRDES